MKNAEVENFHYWSVLVGQAGRSENLRRYLKLILHCFKVIISPHTKFCPHWMKNTDVENFCYWSVLVGWGGRSKNGRSHFKLNLCSFWAIIIPHTKFHPNRMKKTQKLKIFAIVWFWLVGVVDQKMAVAISNSI